MADGSGMNIAPGAADVCLGLDAAITALEAGKAGAGLSVDLGSGQIARLDAGEPAADFLSRLKAHRALLSLASGETVTGRGSGAALMVDSHAKALLDAVKKAR